MNADYGIAMRRLRSAIAASDDVVVAEVGKWFRSGSGVWAAGFSEVEAESI